MGITVKVWQPDDKQGCITDDYTQDERDAIHQQARVFVAQASTSTATVHSVDQLAVTPATRPGDYHWLSEASPIPFDQINRWILSNPDAIKEATRWSDYPEFHSSTVIDAVDSLGVGTLLNMRSAAKPALVTYGARARKTSTTNSMSTSQTTNRVGRKPLQVGYVDKFRSFLEEAASQAASQESTSSSSYVTQKPVKKGLPSPPVYAQSKKDQANKRRARPEIKGAAPDPLPALKRLRTGLADRVPAPAKSDMSRKARKTTRSLNAGVPPVPPRAVFPDNRLSANAEGRVRRQHVYRVPFPLRPQPITRNAKGHAGKNLDSAMNETGGNDMDEGNSDSDSGLQQEKTEIIEDFSTNESVISITRSQVKGDTTRKNAVSDAAAGLVERASHAHVSWLDEDEDDIENSVLNGMDVGASAFEVNDLPMSPVPHLIPPDALSPALTQSPEEASVTTANSASSSFRYTTILEAPSHLAPFRSTGVSALQSPSPAFTPSPQARRRSPRTKASAFAAERALDKPLLPSKGKKREVSFHLPAPTPPEASSSAAPPSSEVELPVAIIASRRTISVTSYLRLAFNTSDPSALVSQAAYDRPSIPKYIPFRILSDRIPLTQIKRCFVSESDLLSGGLFGDGYLGGGRRGHWILPLHTISPRDDNIHPQPGTCASGAIMLGLTEAVPDILTSASTLVVWTLPRLRLLIRQIHKMAEASKWGFLDIFYAAIPYSNPPPSTSVAFAATTWCLKISVQASMALMLRSALSELCCRLDGGGSAALETEHFASEDDIVRGQAGSKWLAAESGINLEWWDEMDRKRILMA